MFSCEFIKFGEDNYASLGLWYYGVDGTCQDTSFEVSEGWFTGGWISGARSCLILSMICGAAACTMISFEWLCCEVCLAGCLEGIALAGAWILGA